MTLIQSIKTAIKLRKDANNKMAQSLDKNPLLHPNREEIYKETDFNNGFVYACKEIIKMIEE